MANLPITSNLQLIQIQQQLVRLGTVDQSQIPMLQVQLSQIQNTISTMDQTDLVAYSNQLHMLYVVQTKLNISNSAAVQTLLQQKIQILHQLISGDS
jgi:hypothetical protein